MTFQVVLTKKAVTVIAVRLLQLEKEQIKDVRGSFNSPGGVL